MQDDFININELEEIGRGRFSRVFAYKHPKTGEDLVVKVPIREDYIHGWVSSQKRARLAIGFANKVNSSEGIVIPRILDIVEDTEQPYCIEELAKGKSLHKSNFKFFSKREKADVIYKLATFMNDMHQAPFEEGDFPVDSRVILTKVRPQIRLLKKAGVFNLIKALLRETAPKDGFQVPIHQDLGPENIFYDRETGDMSILDFGVSKVSNPCLDLYSLGCRYSDHAFPLSFLDSVASLYDVMPKPNRNISVDRALLNAKVSSITMMGLVNKVHKHPVSFVTRLFHAGYGWSKCGFKKINGRAAVFNSSRINMEKRSVPYA
jgi:serine/threonine protein kinase